MSNCGSVPGQYFVQSSYVYTGFFARLPLLSFLLSMMFKSRKGIKLSIFTDTLFCKIFIKIQKTKWFQLLKLQMFQHSCNSALKHLFIAKAAKLATQKYKDMLIAVKTEKKKQETEKCKRELKTVEKELLNWTRY